ncbi:hypothetical protein D3C84_1075130 [compost metagenome]
MYVAFRLGREVTIEGARGLSSGDKLLLHKAKTWLPWIPSPLMREFGRCVGRLLTLDIGVNHFEWGERGKGMYSAGMQLSGGLRSRGLRLKSRHRVSGGDF